MVTEKEFLKNPRVCKKCKEFWLKYHCSRKPWVCIDCANLARNNRRVVKPARLTKDQLKSIEHALMHVEDNHVHERPEFYEYSRDWYLGKRGDFIKRHIKTIALLRDMLQKEE